MLLKSDLVFEQKGDDVPCLGGRKARSARLLAAPSGHGDETFVELDGEGDIFRVSKDLHQMNRLQGEMTGIVKAFRPGVQNDAGLLPRRIENPYSEL